MSCLHTTKEIRRKKNAGGRFVFGYQCLMCGGLVGTWLPKAVGLVAKDWDEAIAEAYHAKARRVYEVQAAQKNAAWRTRYESYINFSPVWQAKRRAVLKRDPICKACESRPSVQVHHLTYQRLGDEPLFDLVGICIPCHEKVHRK